MDRHLLGEKETSIVDSTFVAQTMDSAKHTIRLECGADDPHVGNGKFAHRNIKVSHDSIFL